MKKIISVSLVCVLLAGVMTACGKSFDADCNAVYVQKNGTITGASVETFDKDNYDEEELKEFVDENLEAYQKEHGSKSVKMDKLSMGDGAAELFIKYAGYEDYEAFNGVTLFAGTVPQALAAGYDFDAEFTEIKDGKAKGRAESADITGSDYKVVVLSEKIDVKVDGTIKYVSSDYAAVKAEDTVSIKLPEEAADGEELSLVYIIYE